MPEPRVSRALKRAVTRRAQGCCEYCHSQEQFSATTFSVEHILPRTRGGETEPGNLALSCQGCNGHKYTKTEAPDPVTGATVPLFHPRLHVWSEHFAWTEDYTVVVGLTATGRATMEALHLNRRGLINQRRSLRLTGEHPPGSTL